MEDNNRTEISVLNKLKAQAIALWNKAKGSRVTVIAVFAAAVIVLLAVILGTVFTAKPDVPVAPVVRNAMPYEELSQQIRLTLFDFNIGAEALTESFTIIGGRNIHLMRVNAAENEELVRNLSQLCDRGGLVVATFGMRIVADAPSYRMDIILEAPQTVVEPPVAIPVIDDPAPVVTPPVEKPKNTDRFGNTLPPRGKGQIALLIDDCGSSLALAESLASVNVPMAFAILPHMPYSKETADVARKNGKAVFLHFPMEPLSYPLNDPGSSAVLTTMPYPVIQVVVKNNIENIGELDGVNNHMGSALTADETKIRQTLGAISQYTDTFVDSNTTNKSLALQMCQELGMKCGLNRKFLDNENDHKYIAAKLYEAAILAEKEGGIIAIGHLRPDTVTVLEEVIPQLQTLGYKFVPVTVLTK